MKKQNEFSKMLELGKEDIANLAENELKVLNGGGPRDTEPRMCTDTAHSKCCKPGTKG